MHRPSFGGFFALIAAPILLSMLTFNHLNKKKTRARRNASGLPTAPTADCYDVSHVRETADRFEVFLSFGADTRESFTDHLYNRLLDAGIHAFKYDHELRQGEKIGPDLLEAIKNSEIIIPILSVSYGSSKLCLDELVQIMECKNDNVVPIVLPIFYKVKPATVRHQIGSFGDAFHTCERRFDPAIAEKWKQALLNVGSLKGWEANGSEGQLVKSVVQKVLSKLKYKFELVISKNLVGIDSHVKKVMEVLDNNSSATLFAGIHGMGGIGKTTLAKVIYNMLSSHFEYRSFIPDIRTSCKHKGLEDLQKMLITDILKQNIQVHNKDEGTKLISSMFGCKKVLIVLDDVDDSNQLEVLAGNHNWFSRGSRIIITTRNKAILDNAMVDISYAHELMDKDQSLILFCKHAFQRNSPPSEFEKLTDEVVSTTEGLPLSLVVLGSLLCGKQLHHWRATIRKLEKVPHDDVFRILMESYDALEDEQKQIFLDIACFLIGTDERIAFYMWDACGFFPNEGIGVLRSMSLIEVGDNHELRMHGALRALGREIVRNENLLPQYRSRLWDPKIILQVLKQNQGTEKIQSIYLCKDSIESSGKIADEVGENYTGEQFKNLTSLRFLHMDGAHFSGDFRNSIQRLKWLRWWNCPLNFEADNFYAKELVVLDLSKSKISDKWQGWSSIMRAQKLKFLDLTHCEYLEGTFFLSAFKNLEVLILKSCWRLEQIDSSVGDMKALIHLDISGCTSIEMLNVSIFCSLKILEAENCENLLEIQGLDRLEFLEVMNVSGCTSIERLDLSKSKCMKNLDVGSCENLLAIQDLDKFEFLEELDISWCASIESLHIPQSNKLKVVDARNCESLLQIHGLDRVNFLQSLNISWCPSIERLDLSKCEGLKKLYATYCDNLVEIKGLDRLECLTELYVCGDASMEKLDLPESKCLKMVDAENCENLVEIQGLDRLEFLEVLNISGCISIERLDLSKSKGLKILDAGNCENLVEIQGLNRLKFLKVLNISRCASIEVLDLPKSKDMKILNARYCKRIVKIQGFNWLELLEELNVSGCTSIERLNLPSLHYLKILCAENCENLVEIKSLGTLELLEKLNISRCTSIEILDLSPFEGLKILDTENCENLVEIQGLDRLEFLEVLNISGCTSIRRLDLPKSKSMKKLDAGDCKNLVKIQGLGMLEFLEVLNISRCISIVKLDLPQSASIKILGTKNCENLVEIQGPEKLEQLVELDISGSLNFETIMEPQLNYKKKPFDSMME